MSIFAADTEQKMSYMSKYPTLFLAAVLAAAASCAKIDDVPSFKELPADRQKMDFNIKVTREGQEVRGERTGLMTRSSVDGADKIATMDTGIPFGLIGIDYENGELVLDNAAVSSDGSVYSGTFDKYLWAASERISLSAYYPYVETVSYGDGLENYSIPYSVQDTEAGPLVSKTVEQAVSQLNMIPLVFQHITNDIGFKICDITPDEQLQGLIHVRKVTATNVAQAGIFINDIQNNTGAWHRQAYYRNVVVFEGDEKLGAGMENEKFLGYDTLEDRLADSHRYYSIPDDIEIGKQCVEVVYDVEPFTIGGFTYQALTGQVARFMLYGLLPGNTFVYGKQYTFHLGLDLSKIYTQVSFSASVSDWETSIYENNDDF